MAECRACKAPIVWVKTEAGKLNPMDPLQEDATLASTVSHFATCPKAQQFRRVQKKLREKAAAKPLSNTPRMFE